jgi:N-methylhydantoinase A
MRHDVVRAFYRPVAELDAADVAAVYTQLAEEGSALLEHEGVVAGDRYFARSADMRYVGQEYTVNVTIGEEISLDTIDHDFHETHRTRYGHSTPGAPVEFVNLRLAAMGRIGAGRAPFQAPEDGQDPLLGRRRVVFSGDDHETEVLMRDHLRPGARYDGPLVIEEESSTTVVPPDYTVEVDELGNLLVNRARP